MLDQLGSGIEPDRLDISSELAAPCFAATVQHIEVFENTLCLQFRWDVSGPLVRQNLPAKRDLENLYSFNVVFSSDTSVYRFTGKPVSQTTGLYYEYQRWYDPSIGRFISQDPLSGVLSDPQSLNPYVYVQNIPTVLTDPSGAAEQGPGCVEGLCEGPAPRVNICAQGGCDPRICADNPFICGEEQWQTDTISVTDPRGPPPGDTVTADPQPLKITVPDTTTPTITEPNPIAISDVSTPSTTESIDNVGHFINTEENGGYKGEFQNHHLLPRQFEDYYQSKELTIDDYTMSLDSNLHRIIHGKGAVYETSWNGQWQFYVDNNPGASQEDITSYMYELMYEFGLL